MREVARILGKRERLLVFASLSCLAITVKGTPSHVRSQKTAVVWGERTVDPVRHGPAAALTAARPRGHGPGRPRGWRRRRWGGRGRRGGPGGPAHLRRQGAGARVPGLPAQPAPAGGRRRAGGV